METPNEEKRLEESRSGWSVRRGLCHTHSSRRFHSAYTDNESEKEINHDFEMKCLRHVHGMILTQRKTRT
jgi:hypothetical protein